jgi:hypothetical protein
MAMNRAQFKKQLQEGLNTVFGLEYRRHPEQWRKIFDVETENKKAYVEDVLMTGFGAAPVKEEGAGVQYQSASESYVARYLFETIALAFAITEEAEEDNLYGSIGNRLSKALARSMQHTKEVKCANVLNNGFSGVLGGDGKTLFATDHPSGVGNQSNKLATAADLSETSAEDLLIQIDTATDDKGIPTFLTPVRLLVAPQNRFVAHRLLNSQLRVDSGNNDINALRSLGMFRDGYSVITRLTDPDAWFVKTDCPDGLKHIVRKALKKGMEGDFETGNMRYKARERYIQGWSDWRGAYASEGA